MRILILGAGGVGGYFGARLQAAGGDVSFLVRPARAALLAERGLRVISAFGNLQLTPKLLTTETLRETFDVIIVSCKTYDLASAMDAIAPAVGPGTAVLPLLNGIGHIDTLSRRFGAAQVLGGVALISAAMGPDGDIQHLNKLHRIIAGARTKPASPWLEPLAALMTAAGIDFHLSPDIDQAMWDKIAFLSTLAGACCLMRAPIGVILETRAGPHLINGLLDEGLAIAAACGHPVGETQLEAFRQQLNEPGSPIKASMLRDIERGGPTEAEPILGAMAGFARDKGLAAPLLELAYSHLQAYEAGRRTAPP